MSKIKINKILFIIGIIGLLLVGIIIGSQAFPRTERINIPTDSGKYCFDNDYEKAFQEEAEKVTCFRNEIIVNKAWIEPSITSCLNSNSVDNCAKLLINTKGNLNEISC